MHCSSSSSAVATVIVSEPPDKQGLLDLAALPGTDAMLALEMTAAATLELCSGCLLCLLPMLFLAMKMTRSRAFGVQQISAYVQHADRRYYRQHLYDSQVGMCTVEHVPCTQS